MSLAVEPIIIRPLIMDSLACVQFVIPSMGLLEVVLRQDKYSSSCSAKHDKGYHKLSLLGR